MEQLEKVRKGLECCIPHEPDDELRCDFCPYEGKCATRLKIDAIALINAQQERIKALEAAHQWISVKDRLPDADGDYLVFGQSWYGGQSMAVSIANYVRDISDTGFSDQHRPAWVSIFDWDEFDITHWMPLPELPKEKEHATDNP